jgi:hypothetical protein
MEVSRILAYVRRTPFVPPGRVERQEDCASRLDEAPVAHSVELSLLNVAPGEIILYLALKAQMK